MSDSPNSVCPESTIESANRRNFLRKASIVTAAAAVGTTAIGGGIIPKSSAMKESPNCCGSPTYYCVDVRHGVCIDVCGYCNGNPTLLVCCTFNRLSFGSSSPFYAESIGSQQSCSSYCGVYPPGHNLHGLDFYTNSSKRVSITNSGNVGIGTCQPNAPLSFGEGIGDKVFLFDYPGVKYGLSVFSCQLRVYHGPQSSNFTSFGNYNGTTFTELMRLNNQGQLGIGTSAPGTSLQVNGSVSANVATPCGPYTMKTSDFTVLANGNITLPAASTARGMIVFIKNIGTSSITVSVSGKDHIEGKGSETLSKQYKSLTLVSDGKTPGNWYILSNAT